MTENKNRVPAKQWRKWSDGAREVFNSLYHAMGDQQLFVHKAVAPMPDEWWRVTRWNASWLAASLHDELNQEVVSDRSLPSTTSLGEQ